MHVQGPQYLGISRLQLWCIRLSARQLVLTSKVGIGGKMAEAVRLAESCSQPSCEVRSRYTLEPALEGWEAWTP
jgi:hypothetical protein